MLSSFRNELRSSNDFLLKGKTFDMVSNVSGANLWTYGYKDELRNILSPIIPKLFKNNIIKLATRKPFKAPKIRPNILSNDFVSLLILESFPARNIPAKYITRKIKMNETKFRILVSFINLPRTNANPA